MGAGPAAAGTGTVLEALALMQLIIDDRALLRRKCLPAGRREGGEIARRLFAWMVRNNKRAARGGAMTALGLAAPQFGILKRVCVLRLGGVPIALVNPRLTRHSRAMVAFDEMCLSFPGRKVQTYRYSWAEVEADNLPGPLVAGPRTPEGWHTDDALLDAVCLQHEVAHTAGLLMFDFTGRDYPDPCGWFAGEGG